MSKLTNKNGSTMDQIIKAASKCQTELVIYTESKPGQGLYFTWYRGEAWERWSKDNVQPGLNRDVVRQGPINEMRLERDKILEVLFEAGKISCPDTCGGRLRGVWL